MSKERLKGAFGYTTLDKALKEEPKKEYTEDQVKLSELGIPLDSIETITTGWNKAHDGKKKIFHPNNNSLENITKGFWNYLLDTIHPINLLKIDTTKLTDDLTELTLKQIQNKENSISEDQEILINQLYEKIDSLQEERDSLKKQAQQVVDSVEVMEYNQEIYGLTLHLIEIFIEQEIDAKLTKEEINLIKEMIDKR